MTQTQALTTGFLKTNVDISKLPAEIRSAIQAFQRDNHAATQGNILSAYDALDYYLTWEGIIRYTDNLINLINLFVAIIDEAGAMVPTATRAPVLRINAGQPELGEMPPLNLQTFYVTYGCGSKLAGKYSVVQGPDYLTARRTVNDVTRGEFGFIYDQDDFKGQIEKYGLKEVALQPQGKVE